MVKQLHERQLDLLITTESPKMDELSSQLLGNFTLALYCASPAKNRNELNYLRLEWGPDFQQNEVGLIGSDDVPLLTTSSAELIYQQLSRLNGCCWLPARWAKGEAWVTYGHGQRYVIPSTLCDLVTNNSDKQAQIHEILKNPILE